MEIKLSPKVKQILSSTSVLLLIFLILFFRNPVLFRYPMPHGEDLGVFLGQEYSIGFPDTALILYAGYIHLLPRIIAWISLKFDWSNAMLVMDWTVMFIKVFIFYMIFKSKEINSNLIKFSLLMYLLLVPWADEIYNNVTNLQWWLIPLMMVIIIRRETSTFGLIFSCCVLLLSGLTGINSIVFAVPCVYLLLKVKTKDCLLKTLIIVLCAFIQLYCLLSSSRMGKGLEYNYIFSMGGGWIVNLINMFVIRVIYQTLFNLPSTSSANIFVFLLYISILAVNLYYYRNSIIVRFIFLFSIIYSISILYSLIKIHPNLEFFIKVTRGGAACERYFVFLRICSFILLISSLNMVFKYILKPEFYKKFMAYSCFLLCLVLLHCYPSGIQAFQVRSKYYADIEKIKTAKVGEIVTIHNVLVCGPKEKRRAWICYDLKKK